MAAGEREDQVPDAANTSAADATGRAAPAAQRKQQGHSRQFLGTFGKEVDAERLVQLRKENLEYRLEREKNEERQRKRNEEMAEAYRNHKAEAAAKAKEERRIHLARLEAQSQRRAERSLTLSEREDEMVDEEYRILLERYGHRVRVPQVPSDPWKQQQSVASTDSARSRAREARAREAELRKPNIPRAKPRAAPAGDAVRAVGNPAADASSSSVSVGAAGAADKKKAQTQGGSKRGSTSQQPPAGGVAALPVLATPTGAARSATSGHRGSGHRLSGHNVTAAATQAAPARTAEPLAGDSVMSEVPEPERSLMPRKDALRKFQQALIKKTDVSFYKIHMKRHFRRILEATELTFNDTNGRREQAGWNLAKPLSIAEIKQLSSVVVRNA